MNVFKTKTCLPIYLLLIIVVSMGAYVYWDFLTFKSWLLHCDVGYDPITQWWPYLVHLSEYLRTDGLPMWSFSFGLGQNIFPSGLNDPFRCILYLFKGNNLLYALGYIQLLKILLAATFFYLYLRTVSLSTHACMIGAILYAFCGHMILGGCWFTFSTDVVITAFLLYSFELYFKRGKWFFLPIAVFTFGTNHLFYFYFFTVLLFSYALLRYLSEYAFDFRRMALFFLKLSRLYILGIFLSSVYILPEISEALQHSRVSGESSFFLRLIRSPIFEFASLSIYISELFRPFSNDILGTGKSFTGWDNYIDSPILYCGLLTLLLVPQLFRLANKRLRLLFSVPILFSALYLVFPYFRYLMNGFMTDNFYMSALFITIVLVGTAAKSLDIIIRRHKIDAKLLILTSIVLIGILLGGIVILNGGNIGGARLNIRVVITCIIFVLTYSVVIYSLKFSKMRPVAIVLLIVVVCFEMAWFSSITINDRPTLLPRAITGRAWGIENTKAALRYLKTIDNEFYRIKKHKYYCISFNDAQVLNYKGTKSYNSFNNQSYLNFNRILEVPLFHPGPYETRTIQGFGERYLLDTLVGVKYYFVKKKEYAPVGYVHLKSFGDIHLFRNRNFLPLGFAYTSYVLYDDFVRFSTKGKDETLLKAFVLEEGESKPPDLSMLTNDVQENEMGNESDYAADVDKLRQSSLKLTKHKQNYLEGVINLEHNALVFFSIPYDKGWTLKVDGEKVKLRKVNIGFMGAYVNKGKHKIILSYVTPLFVTGLLFSMVAATIYLALVIVACRRNRSPAMEG